MAMLVKRLLMQAWQPLSSLFYHLDYRLDGDARQMSAHASMAAIFLAILPYKQMQISCFFLVATG